MKRTLWLRLFALAALLMLPAPLSPARAGPPVAELAQAETLSEPVLAAPQFCFAADNAMASIPDAVHSSCGVVVRPLTLNCANASGRTISNVILSTDITHLCSQQVGVQLSHGTRIFSSALGSLPCAAATPLSWSTSVFNGEPVNGLYELRVSDCTGGLAGTLRSWSNKVEYNIAPTVLSATPGSGAACPSTVRTFRSVLEDADGASDIDAVEFLFDQGDLAKVNQVYLQYSRRLNQLYMRNAANSAWLGGFAPGENQVIETPLARLHVQDTTASTNGNQLTVNWAIEFLPPYAGKVYRQMLYVTDLHDGLSGWENMGNWSVSCVPLGGVTQRTYLPSLLRPEFFQ